MLRNGTSRTILLLIKQKTNHQNLHLFWSIQRATKVSLAFSVNDRNRKRAQECAWIYVGSFSEARYHSICRQIAQDGKRWNINRADSVWFGSAHLNGSLVLVASCHAASPWGVGARELSLYACACVNLCECVSLFSLQCARTCGEIGKQISIAINVLTRSVPELMTLPSPSLRLWEGVCVCMRGCVCVNYCASVCKKQTKRA